MTNEQKNSIIAYALEWIAKHEMNQSELGKLAQINAGYLSNMLRNIYTVEVAGQPAQIADKWFYKLANAIGFSVKKEYWGIVQTKEFERVIHELTIAKNDTRVSTIIINTGYGKTYTIGRFCMINPMHTYKITVNSEYKIRHILRDIAEQLGTTVRHDPIDTLIGITKRLVELKMQGHKPMIIIDEAENLRLPAIQMLKGIYDKITGYASIVLIGTPQLMESLLKMKNHNKAGAPQFYRRIKAGVKEIPSSKNFTPFFEKFKIIDKGLIKLLNATCDNYGELHDYLEPALKEADENEKPLTESMFRLLHNLPNYQ